MKVDIRRWINACLIVVRRQVTTWSLVIRPASYFRQFVEWDTLSAHDICIAYTHLRYVVYHDAIVLLWIV